MHSTRVSEQRQGAGAASGPGQVRAYGSPGRLWRLRERQRSRAAAEWNPDTVRRCRRALARSVNALHPHAKTRFAMRILDSQPGFRNPWAPRLERQYGQMVPSVLLLGLEPQPGQGCSGCPAAGSCPRDGSTYHDLARTAMEAHRLGIRLFLVAGARGGGVGRYLPELTDLALRHPDCTFVAFAGAYAPETQTASALAEAGNVALAFRETPTPEAPIADLGASRRDRAGAGSGGIRDRRLETLREAGAPFGFVAGFSLTRGPDTGAGAWVEGLLERGHLFGILYPPQDPRIDPVPERPGGGPAPPKTESPLPLMDLQAKVVFTDESLARHGGMDRRPGRPLLVHAVSPAVRSLTLLESIEAASGAPGAGGRARACPLLLGRGDTRGSLYALLSP